MTTHKSPAELSWLFVPAGATGSILTNINVIHQPITIQETLPCEEEHEVVRGRENHTQIISY